MPRRSKYTLLTGGTSRVLLVWAGYDMIKVNVKIGRMTTKKNVRSGLVKPWNKTKQVDNLNPKSKVVILKIGALLPIFHFHNSVFLFQVCEIKPFHYVKDVQVLKISSKVTHYNSFKIEKAVSFHILTQKVIFCILVTKHFFEIFSNIVDGDIFQTNYIKSFMLFSPLILLIRKH